LLNGTSAQNRLFSAITHSHGSLSVLKATKQVSGHIIDRKLLNSRFCACAVKICTKLAYSVVKLPQF